MSILAAAIMLGCGRPRPAESFKGPVRVRIENKSLAPIAQAMLVPVGALETQPWLEHLAPGKTTEAFVRADRYDLWFFAELPESSSFVLAGGRLDVPLTGPATIVVEREGIRSMAQRPADVIVVTMKQISKEAK